MDLKKLALEICKEVIDAVDLLKHNEPDFILEKYNAKLFCKNQPAKLKHKTNVFETFIKGVNHKGQLITGQQGENCYNFGEVEWMH